MYMLKLLCRTGASSKCVVGNAALASLQKVRLAIQVTTLLQMLLPAPQKKVVSQLTVVS